MFKNKFNFLLFISLLSSNLQSAEVTNMHQTVGRKLRGLFDLEIEKKKATQNPLSGKNIRIKLTPGEGFSGFGSDTIKGFVGVLIGSKKVFFKLPKQNPICLATFLSALYNEEELLAEHLSIINLFFQGNITENMLGFLEFENAYEVTLKDGSQALVLTPHAR